jgi:inorganic phosphate transporter, PiT family
MSSVAGHTLAAPRPTLDRKPSRATVLLFLILLLIGVGYTGYSLVTDVNKAMPHGLALLSFFLLGVALLMPWSRIATSTRSPRATHHRPGGFA